MNRDAEKAAAWMYRGIWRVLSDLFRVPPHPPTLPIEKGDSAVSFHPSRRYLSYLKFYFWIALFIIDLAILAGWIAIYFWSPRWGLILALPAFLVAGAPDILAYIAIHLRYDTMWYVMSSRSLRCRRGIWVILEHTITFENVQNVNVRRGPLQYFFGISTIVVETAGADEGEGNEFAVGNKAIMEGIGNPREIRDLIMERVRESKSAGLGDDRSNPPHATAGWTEAHLRVLREVRDGLRGTP